MQIFVQSSRFMLKISSVPFAFAFSVCWSDPALCCEWEVRAPAGSFFEELIEYLYRKSATWHFTNDLIMYV